MSENVVDDIVALLKRDGFSHITKQKSSVSTTVSATKQDARVVIHLAGAENPPQLVAIPLHNAAAGRDVHTVASLPGVPLGGGVDANLAAAALRNVRTGAGGGSAKRARRAE